MTQEPSLNDSLVISYLGLRKAVGIIGTALPFVLAFGNILLEGPGIQSSISSYYYTGMRDVFVGSLCAIAVFLMSYHGYERQDDIAGDLACVFALGVALFPTTPDADVAPRDKIIGALHLLFAACLFLTLAFFSLVLFRKTDPTRAFVSSDSPVKRLDPVFWLEATAIVAFGVSWFTKGEAIRKDET